MSKFCQILTFNTKEENKERKQKINEEEVLELCTRIWSLVNEYDKQTEIVK